MKRNLWIYRDYGFAELGFFGGPYYKDCSMLGSISGSLSLRDYHVPNSLRICNLSARTRVR